MKNNKYNDGRRCSFCGSVVMKLRYSEEYPEYNFECKRCGKILHDKVFE